MAVIKYYIIGLAFMIISVFYLGKRYQIPAAKRVIIALCIMLIGYSATEVMFFVENGEWGGRSFFGAVFLIPPFMILAAHLLKLNRGDVLDLCAPAGCIMLAVMKIGCHIEGCCRGRVMKASADGVIVRFPSQIVEAGCGFMLYLIMIIIFIKGRKRHLVYPWCMYLYGLSRFILNFFRDVSPRFWILANGNIWALLSLSIGIVWLLVAQRRSNVKI